MKEVFRIAGFAALICTSSLTQAMTVVPQHFVYSYTFSEESGGGQILGTFDGFANGNLVTDLANITAYYDGVAFNGSGNLTNVLGINARASFDGLQNNFIFSDAPPSNLENYTNRFISVDVETPESPYGPTSDVMVVERSFAQPQLVLDDNQLGNPNQFSAARWSLALAPVSSVPEPESYAMLLAGLGLMGAVVRRRGRSIFPI